MESTSVKCYILEMYSFHPCFQIIAIKMSMKAFTISPFFLCKFSIILNYFSFLFFLYIYILQNFFFQLSFWGYACSISFLNKQLLLHWASLFHYWFIYFTKFLSYFYFLMSAQAHASFMAWWLWKNSTSDEQLDSPSNLKVE